MILVVVLVDMVGASVLLATSYNFMIVDMIVFIVIVVSLWVKNVVCVVFFELVLFDVLDVGVFNLSNYSFEC